MALGELYTDDINNVTLRIDGEPWYLLQATVELTTSTTPDFVDLVLSPTTDTVETLPDNPTLKQENGGLLGTEFVLEIDTELSAGPRGSEQTKLFSGNLANLSPAGQGAWEALAWDPSHQAFASGEGDANSGNFLNNEIMIPASEGEKKSPEGPQPNGDLTNTNYSEGTYNTPGATSIKATSLVDRIIEQSPLEPYEVEKNFSEAPGIEVGQRPNGTTVYGGADRYLYFSNNRITVSKALERIELTTNSTWWFDKDGIFHIGAPVPGNPVHAFDLQFITDTSAGKSSPAWQGVQVIGSGVVSEDGWDRANMNSADPATSIVSLADDGKVDTDKLAEPVFTYRNLEIQTQAEADAVAKEIVNKLTKQQSEGKITVIGFPEVRPLDAVEMPNSDRQPMGGARYSVHKVVHNINPQDGFITDIHVGGLTREGSTMYNEEIPDKPVPTSLRPPRDLDRFSSDDDTPGSGGSSARLE